MLKRKWLSWQVARYLQREIVFSFVTGTTIFLLIMLLFQAIRLSEFVVVHQVSLWDVGKLSFHLLVSFLPLAVPIAFLFAVLIGIARANAEGELLALQVNGFSLPQVFFPLAVFSVLVSFTCLYLALYSVPQGNRKFELLFTKLMGQHVISQLKPGVFQSGFFGLTLYAEKIVPIKNEMKRVFLYDERELAHPLVITANEGILRGSAERGLITLRLTSGSIYVDKRSPDGPLRKLDFDVYDINLSVDVRGDVTRDYSPPSYTYPQLVKKIEEVKYDPGAQRELKVEFHRRFSLSFSCVVFAALGFFIGALSHRGARSIAVLLCLGVGLVYWLFYLAANALAARGVLSPWLGCWLANFVFLGVAYFCYRRYGRA